MKINDEDRIRENLGDLKDLLNDLRTKLVHEDWIRLEKISWNLENSLLADEK